VPTFTLVAGPNGSGKSTLTGAVTFEGSCNVVDADAIARGLDPELPARAAFAAARQTILRCRTLLDKRESFTLESTLAGHGALSLMRGAKNAGYRTLLVYVALRDPELHIERVRLRVAQGGHDIPDADIRRRYARSLFNASEAMRLADEVLVLDNSGPQPESMMRLRNGQIFWRASSLPLWVQKLALSLE
jgi:predicted ABC-type ATPase